MSRFRLNNGESIYCPFGQFPLVIATATTLFLISYKHAIDGLIRVYREEGVRRMFAGASTATSRAVLMTIGQLSFYDQIKQTLLNSGHFQDNLITHFTASLSAVSHNMVNFYHMTRL